MHRYVAELDTINKFSDLLHTKHLPYHARSSLSLRRALVMDVAKRLADWKDQPPEQWFTAINRYLPPVATALIVIAIAYQLATLTWTARPRLGLRSRARFAPGDRRQCGTCDGFVGS